MKKATRFSVLSVLAAAALGLSGCGQGGTDASSQSPSSTSSVKASASLTVADPWVKAADSGMSAGFGTISNTSEQDITIVSASTPTSPMVELHETVMGSNGTMQMQAKEGGFVIPAKGDFVLEPGGNHIMLMGLSAPVQAGDDITFDLMLSDGSDLTFTAQGKDFVGADENYVGGEEPTDGATMDHSTMDNGSMEHGAATENAAPTSDK